MLKHPKNKLIVKWFLIIGGILLAAGAALYIYYATLKYGDTANIKAEYIVEAMPFLKEYEKDYKAANIKYAEKIIAVTGMVTETELVDTTINIKMSDTTTGSYLIFDFQKLHLEEAKTLKPGDLATIKGSCSDGIYSLILGAYFVSFKRSTLIK